MPLNVNRYINTFNAFVEFGNANGAEDGKAVARFAATETMQLGTARKIVAADPQVDRVGKSRNQEQKELNDSFLNVTAITGLKGRWQTVGTNPLVICDIGHNVGAWEQLSKQIAAVECRQKHIVFGMVDDKDIYGVRSLLPKDAIYYFTKPTTKRALPEQSVMVFGQQFGLAGECYPTVAEAFSAALIAAEPDDFIFVGGSNYVVADFLKSRD